MPIIQYDAPIQLLVAVRGHPFDRTAFDQLFLGMKGIAATMVDQPAAAQLMNPAMMAGYDALVLYDMPGLDFRARTHPVTSRPPAAALRDGLAALLTQGKGVVALHHALAGWPDWPDYAAWLGGRFAYRAATWQGRTCADSGYRNDVQYTARLVGEHPVTAGLPPSFALNDELYLAEIDDEGMTPLLVADYPFDREHFWSAAAAVRGEPCCREGWQHPSGSNVIAWTRRAINSPLVYLQPGDGPQTYANPHYRRLVENAVRWVVSPASRPWALPST